MLVAAHADAQRGRVAAAVAAERATLQARAEAEAQRSRDDARAAGIVIVGAAEAGAEEARLAAYRDASTELLHALALREFAGNLPEIGQLTVTPDVVSDLLARIAR